MSKEFILSCESTVDLPYSYVEKREIPVAFYSYTIDGVEYPDDMGRDKDALPKFYKFLSDGKLPTTSQLILYRYLDFFEEILGKGKDILHIAFGSGMTPSVNNAKKAAEMLKEKYPDQKIVVIDSLCSSSGYGLIVDYAADMRDEGKSIDETAEWVENNSRTVHHQFFSADIKYFRRSGRVSGAAAMAASVLGICPIMRLDDNGKIIAYDKVRGKKNAIKRTIDEMLIHAQNGADYSGKCFVAHSNCESEALETIKSVEDNFPNLKGKIKICDIGTIIASHCGPGTVAVFFLGDERQPDKKK